MGGKLKPMIKNREEQTLTYMVLTPCGAFDIEYDCDGHRFDGDAQAIAYFNEILAIGVVGDGGMMLSNPPEPSQIEFLNGAGGMSVVDFTVAALPEISQTYLDASMDSAIDDAAHEAQTSPTNDMPEPTQAQKEAGNYKKGRISISGLSIAIENPAGSVRSGVSKGGLEWSNTMMAHYGYVVGSLGADGDAMDVYVKDGTDDAWCGKVYVVNQVFEDTQLFDEHKCMIGFDTLEEAVANYRSNFGPTWRGLGTVDEMSFGNFKRFVASAK